MTWIMTLRAAILTGLLPATFVLGCTAAEPPRHPVSDAAPTEERADTGPTSCESEIGGMSEEDVTDAFAAMQPGVMDCVEQGTARVGSLGGHVGIRLRVDRKGGVRWAFITESTLGDRETEKCVLDLARARTWPRPLGGEGIAESSFDIDAKRTPTVWTDKQVGRAVATARRATTKCRKGIAGPFAATVYVRSDGHVLAAGVAPPSEKGEEAADCVVSAIRELRFQAGGAKTAKVSFEIR
jgi:hypothetical protein